MGSSPGYLLEFFYFICAVLLVHLVLIYTFQVPNQGQAPLKLSLLQTLLQANPCNSLFKLSKILSPVNTYSKLFQHHPRVSKLSWVQTLPQDNQYNKSFRTKLILKLERLLKLSVQFLPQVQAMLTFKSSQSKIPSQGNPPNRPCRPELIPKLVNLSRCLCRCLSKRGRRGASTPN